MQDSDVLMSQFITWSRCVHGPGFYLVQMCTWPRLLLGPDVYMVWDLPLPDRDVYSTRPMLLLGPGCSQPRLLLAPDVNMVQLLLGRNVYIVQVSAWSICVHGPGYHLVQVCTLPRLLLGPLCVHDPGYNPGHADRSAILTAIPC